MLVYADRERRLSPADCLSAIAAEIGRGDREALTDAFVRAAELAQGLVDAEFAASGADDWTPIHRAAIALLLDCARRLRRPSAAPFENPFAGLALPASVAVRTAEGFAHYAVYPEAFLVAGERVRATTVIGLRSIGFGLGALVAAGCGAARLFSLRPVGEPYRRRLTIAPALEAALLSASDALIAVVDEGPGQSGSSIAAVAHWLVRHGVAAERIVFVPSHGGEPGSAAGEFIRTVWRTTRRVSLDFDDLFVGETAQEPLARWFEDLTGPPIAPLQDLSGGGWRRGCPDAPPAYEMQERRKFLLQTTQGRFLLKFAGLGVLPRRKLARAQALYAAGFGAEPLALRRGFLLKRWLDAAPSARVDARDIARVAAYLGFRAEHFAAPEHGASFAELAAMAEHNIAEGAGAETAAAALAPFAKSRLATLEREVRAVDVDGRMHLWEWLRVGDRLVKTDALDHSDGHDLVGRQDIAWDVAGAAVELGLDARLLVDAMPAPTRPSADLVAFLRVAYLGFQLGLWTFAATAAPQDRALAAVVDRYRAHVRALPEGCS